MASLAIPFLLAMGLALGLTPLACRIAVNIGAMDHPGERRIHVIATPRLGGPAIFLAVFGGLFVASRIGAAISPQLNGAMLSGMRGSDGLALAALMIVTMGAIDDVRGLRPIVKLLVEIGAAAVAVSGGYRLESLGSWHFGVLAVPLSILLIVAVINAVNLVDGLDGLAVGLCLVIASMLMVLNLAHSERVGLSGLAALCGATAGFLPHNFHPARIFLGDSGALLLGFLAATATISTSQRMSGGIVPAFAPFLLLGLPLAELTLTIMRRFLRGVRVVGGDRGAHRYRLRMIGRPALFRPDRDHIHHRLLARGIGHRRSVLLLYLVGGASCAAAWLLTVHSEVSSVAFWGCFAIAVMGGVRWLGYPEFRAMQSGLLLLLLQPIAFVRGAVPRSFELVADLFTILVSIAGATLIEDGANFSTRSSFTLSIAALAILQAVAFAASGLYQSPLRSAGADELLPMAKAVGWAAVSSLLASTLVPSLGISLRAVLLDAYLLATLTLGARLSFRVMEHLFEQHYAESERLSASEAAPPEAIPDEVPAYSADEAITSRRGAAVIPIRRAGISS